MSMIGSVARVEPEVLAFLHEHPELIIKFLSARYDPTPEKPDQISGAGRTSGLLSWLLRPLKFGSQKPQLPAKELPPHIQPLQDSEELCLDKNWHLLHYLLTGTAWEGEFPAGFLLTSGREIGGPDYDVGYGPARSFETAETQQIAQYLREIIDKPDPFKARLIFDKMAPLKLYCGPDEQDDPDTWDEDENWNWLQPYLTDLRDFVNQTAEQRKALIIYLN